MIVSSLAAAFGSACSSNLTLWKQYWSYEAQTSQMTDLSYYWSGTELFNACAKSKRNAPLVVLHFFTFRCLSNCKPQSFCQNQLQAPGLWLLLIKAQWVRKHLGSTQSDVHRTSTLPPSPHAWAMCLSSHRQHIWFMSTYTIISPGWPEVRVT